MTHEQAAEAVRTALGDIAPEVDAAELNTDAPLREQAEIDSFDYLNFLLRIQELTGVEVPEKDYERVRTWNGLVGYLTGH
jgi:acyl carrier protein